MAVLARVIQRVARFESVRRLDVKHPWSVYLTTGSLDKRKVCTTIHVSLCHGAWRLHDLKKRVLVVVLPDFIDDLLKVAIGMRKGWSMQFGSIKVKFVVPAHAYWCRKALPLNSIKS